MLDWLKGKKTYLIVGITFVLGGLQATGLEVPPFVYAILAALGFGALRAAVKKAEA